MKRAVDVLRGRVHPLDAVEAAVPRIVRDEHASGPAYDPAAARLVLSPHLDDAVLSCWGELSADGEVAVVNVFSARPDAADCSLYDRIAGATDARVRMEERAVEDRHALALSGRAPRNLHFLESAYRRRAPAARHLLRALGGHCPAASAVLAPAGIGFHPDHLLVRNAALLLRRGGMPVELYADMPYCAAYGWPAWVTGQPPRANLVIDAYWEPALDAVSARGLTLTSVPRTLTDEQRSSKLEAMRRYATQYPTLTRGPLDVLAHPEVLGFELKWRVEDGSTRAA